MTTDSERDVRIKALSKKYNSDPKVIKYRAFSAGYKAGLGYQQARLDKLLAYIRGEIPMSEIEDIVNA